MAARTKRSPACRRGRPAVRWSTLSWCRSTRISSSRRLLGVVGDLRGDLDAEDFTHASSGAFSGYRWPPDVIVTAVRWYLSYPLSARSPSSSPGVASMSRPGPCSPGPKPSVPSSRQPPGGIVVGLADAGRSTRSSSSMAPPSGTSTALSMSTARWSTYCLASAPGPDLRPGVLPPRPGDRRDRAGGHRHRSPSALRQGSSAEPARLAALSDRPPSS